MADVPSVRSGSLGRYFPAAVSWDFLGAVFRFSRPTRSWRCLGDSRTAAVVGCRPAQEMQENVGEGRDLRTRWVVEGAVHVPPHEVVSEDLCHLGAEDSKTLWVREGRIHRVPAAAGQKRVAHQQRAVAMVILQVVLPEVRPVGAVARMHHIGVYQVEHHQEQPKRVRKQSSRRS